MRASQAGVRGALGGSVQEKEHREFEVVMGESQTVCCGHP